MELVWMLVLLSVSLNLVDGARSCDYRPVPECTCWNQRRPAIGCSNVGLKKLPDLPVDYINSLDLSYNGIMLSQNSKLGHGGLVLTRLKLSHWSAHSQQTFPDGFFDHIKASLKLLDISYNPGHIHAIPTAVRDLKSLEVLDLSYNNVTTLNQDDFQGLARVKYLHLLGNPIHDIRKNSFRPMRQNLLALSLTIKPSHLVAEPGFIDGVLFAKYLGNLKWVHLDLQYKTDDVNTFLYTFFSLMKDLVELRLDGSSNWVVSSFMFFPNIIQPFKHSIKVLSLANTHLGRMKTRFLQDLEMLQQLDLSHNDLQRLLVPPMSQLRKLLVHSNKLSRLPDVIAGNNRMPNLEIIDVRNNSITYVDACFKRFSNSHVQVLISLNPINCECHYIKWLGQRTVNRKNSCLDPDDLQSLRCQDPRGELVTEFARLC